MLKKRVFRMLFTSVNHDHSTCRYKIPRIAYLFASNRHKVVVIVKVTVPLSMIPYELFPILGCDVS